MKLFSILNNKFYSWNGLIFNLLCAIYFVFISPLVLDISTKSLKSENTYYPILAIIILIVSVLEIYAFPQKMKFVHKAIMDKGLKLDKGFILWIFHIVISIATTFLNFELFGVDTIGDNGGENITWWMSLILFIVIIKELYFLLTIIGLHDEKDTLMKFKRPNKKEWIIDLILVIYASLIYTVTWQTISSNTNMDKHNLAMYILNLVIASIMFLMFYMPLRIPYYLEEIALIKTKKGFVKFIFSILIVLISAMYAL